MVTPINFTALAGELSGRALNNWLRTSGAALIRSFETGADALRYLTENGVDIARSTFYDIRKQVLDLSSSSLRLANYETERLVPLNWHVKNHGLNLTTDFQYRLHMFGTDPETGLVKDQWVTIVSDRQLTVGEVQSAGLNWLVEYDEVNQGSKQIDDPIFGEIEPMRR
jgi:hypothetical protein